MLEVKYLVVLNSNDGYFARIKTSQKSRNALNYQKLLARISKVLDRNLNKSLAINCELLTMLFRKMYDNDINLLFSQLYPSYH